MVESIQAIIQSQFVVIAIERSIPIRFKSMEDFTQQQANMYYISQMKKEKKCGNKLDVVV